MATSSPTKRKRVGRPAGPATRVVRLPLSIAAIARRVAIRKPRVEDIQIFFDVQARTHANIPLMSHKASCGFPSPADDYLDRPLDFNELLVANPAATFAVRVGGDSMINAGLYPDDIAVVDRSLTARDKNIILALVDGEFTIKRYRKKASRVWLQAENPAYNDIKINEETAFEVWGVIKYSVRMLEPK
jgi:DNA polymerase V